MRRLLIAVLRGAFACWVSVACLACLGSLGVAGVATGASADEPAKTDPPDAGRQVREEGPPDLQLPPTDLDRLLRVPRGVTGVTTPRERRGDRDRDAWRTAFVEARAEVAELEERVSATQAELRETSDTSISYTPAPGAIGSPPEVQALRARLRRDRQSLETAQRRLRDLEVEASLAGVPDEWVETDEPTGRTAPRDAGRDR